jgi:hypothetical protein
MVDEVRLERLRPAQVDAALARASVAWVPLGALEFHAPHLPIGTDGFTAHGRSPWRPNGSAASSCRGAT